MCVFFLCEKLKSNQIKCIHITLLAEYWTENVFNHLSSWKEKKTDFGKMFVRKGTFVTILCLQFEEGFIDENDTKNFHSFASISVFFRIMYAIPIDL